MYSTFFGYICRRLTKKICMMVKKSLVYATLKFLAVSSFAQNNEIKVKFSGFVKADYWIDNRKHTTGVDGLFVYYPTAPDYDANGKDMNKQVSLNGSALSTRTRVNITGLDAFGAKTAACIEGDFTGTNDVALFRIRLANVNFNWGNANLLIGQAWHPICIPQFLPRVLSLNTGAPFQCFNRNPQLTFTYSFNNGFKILGSANWQSGYESFGPAGKSSIYLRNASIPNLDFQISKAFGKSTIGVAYDFKSLRPNIFNTNAANQKYTNNNTVKSSSFLAYYNYTSEKLFLLTKALYGQNLSEHLMQGGYGVSSTDLATGIQSYSPSKIATFLFNACYGTTYKVGGIVGYLKNLGFTKNVTMTFGRDLNLESLIRIAPNFTYTCKNLSLGCEAEYNRAAWGTVDNSNKGKIKDAKSVNGFRFLTTLQYNF